MEITFARSSLYEAVAAVSPAVQERSPKPALQSMHVSASEDGVVFSGVDIDTGICIRATVKPKAISNPGTALVHGTRLAALLHDVAADEVRLAVDGDRAEICAGKSSFKLNCQDPEEYPELPSFPGEDGIPVPGGKLAELIRRTVFATAPEQGRYAINGVALSVDKGRIELAATDGKRLAVANAPVETQAKMALCIASPRMLAEVRRVGQGTEKVLLAAERGRLLAQAGPFLVAGNLIEGTFPAYAEMIPKPAKQMIGAKASALAASLRQAAHLTPQESRAVIMRASPGVLKIEAKSAAIGEAFVELPVTYSGAAMTLAFNPWFFLDILPELGDEEVSLEIDGPDRPAVIRRQDYVYVVAPIKLRDEDI